ncbi:MAG TPA: membrane fusion protein MtrC [Candidatus Limnocylindria bacterium]|nr:membrane fusion protein MtrC [Candidatus Limnocylindria bacterium]
MKSLRSLLVALALVGLPAFAAEPKNPPAKVTNSVKESELTSITLTPEAEKRLGVEMAAVERGKVERTRVFGGELIMPAPATTNGQNIFAMLPALSPTELIRIAEAQIDADAQVDRAKVTMNAAKVTLDRAEKLVAEKAGTVRAVDDAKAQVALAEAGVRAAKARRDLLGAPILDFADLKTFWVRVPVYVGDTARMNTSANAQVGDLAARPGAKMFQAQPVPAPPSANAAASTVDLFYELLNEGGAFRFGQKVGVNVPLRETEETLVVPWSAIIYDINGGTWVYENTAPHTFVRRRVQLRRVIGKAAALDAGPKVGAKVVTVAVAELFGTEFGPGK